MVPILLSSYSGQSGTASSTPLLVFRCLGFFLLWGRWGWQAGGRGIQLYRAMPSDPPPSSAFQPIRPAVGSGSKELPPKGLHLACSSIWPAHRPKLRDIKSQGPGSALTRADELQGGLHMIWGDRTKENSSSGSALK